jgi:hypothetical protein
MKGGEPFIQNDSALWIGKYGFNIVTILVTVDAVWIGNRIY